MDASLTFGAVRFAKGKETEVRATMVCRIVFVVLALAALWLVAGAPITEYGAVLL